LERLAQRRGTHAWAEGADKAVGVQWLPVRRVAGQVHRESLHGGAVLADLVRAHHGGDPAGQCGGPRRGADREQPDRPDPAGRLRGGQGPAADQRRHTRLVETARTVGAVGDNLGQPQGVRGAWAEAQNAASPPQPDR